MKGQAATVITAESGRQAADRLFSHKAGNGGMIQLPVPQKLSQEYEFILSSLQMHGEKPTRIFILLRAEPQFFGSH